MALFDLGLTEHQFWSMTPAEFGFMWERWMGREERSDRRVASILATVSNCYRDTKKKPQPFTMDDFLDGEVEPPRPLTQKEQMGMMKLHAVAAGAKPKDLPAWAMSQTKKIEQSKLRRATRIAAKQIQSLKG